MVSPLQGLHIVYPFTQGFTLGYYIAGPSALIAGGYRYIGGFLGFSSGAFLIFLHSLSFLIR